MYKSPFRAAVRCTGGYPQYNSPPGPKTNSSNEHHGEDYVPQSKNVEANWSLYSPIEGTVIRSNNNDAYGNCVVIAGDDGYWVLLAHLKTREVKLGQRVLVGQRVGVAGWTGNVKPPNINGRHLHIEVADMRGSSKTWNYKAHCAHRLRPSDYIDFGSNVTPNKEDEGGMVWTNGSTKELVYQTTTDCQEKKDHIGSLAPREVCECRGVIDGCYLVVYTVNGTKAKKCGFVSYAGGVKI